MKSLLLICLMLCSIAANAQNLFNQKKTKLKYIAQQIALFELYAGYLQEGYDIAQEGWRLIDDIKEGDFDLHNNYFNSLKQVNASISDYAKIDRITTLQEQVLKVDDAIKKIVSADENISTEEKEYINKVMSGLLAKCADNNGQLKILITSGTIEMKDDERLQRIDDLYLSMQEKYTFSKSFYHAIQVLALSRAKHSNDLNTSRLLYDIN